MITLILCLRPLRVPKYVWFKILRDRRYEFGLEMIKNETPDDVLLGAAQCGNLKLAQWTIAQGADDFLEPYIAACSRGHVEIAKLTKVRSGEAMKMAGRNGHWQIVMCEEDEFDFMTGTSETGQLEAFKKFTVTGWLFNYVMTITGKNGQWAMINYIISTYEINTYAQDSLIHGICAGGFYEQAVYYMDLYGKNWSSINPYFVCTGGNEKLIKLIMRSDHQRTEEGLIGACKGGHIELVRYFLQLDATSINVALAEAVERNRIDIVKLLLETGNAEFEYMTVPCNIEMIKLLISYNYIVQDIIYSISSTNDVDIMEYILSLGSFRLEDALDRACYTGRKKMALFLIGKGAVPTERTYESIRKGGHQFKLLN